MRRRSTTPPRSEARRTGYEPHARRRRSTTRPSTRRPRTTPTASSSAWSARTSGCSSSAAPPARRRRSCRSGAATSSASRSTPTRRRSPSSSPSESIVADLDLLDVDEALGDDTFDVIIAADVLEHLRDPQRVLTACLEHLRPGGEVLLSIPNVAHADVRLVAAPRRLRLPVVRHPRRDPPALLHPRLA